MDHYQVETMLKITGGTIHDPTNGIDGEVGDLWITDGRFVDPPTDPATKPTRTIDATGFVVMPGGIDMHCHIAGPKVNMARKMRPEEKRADTKI
ncbi:MAG: amidohydrolase family protein, partial [Planctomycetales bacterium]